VALIEFHYLPIYAFEGPVTGVEPWTMMQKLGEAVVYVPGVPIKLET